MSISHTAKSFLNTVRQKFSVEDAQNRLSPKDDAPVVLRTIAKSFPTQCFDHQRRPTLEHWENSPAPS